MSFLDDMRKDHPAHKKPQKNIEPKDFAAMYNTLSSLFPSFPDLPKMIECSQMIETHYLTSRKKRTACDLTAIRSWIITELGIDLSLFAVRSLVLYVSVYRMEKKSKKNGYCRLAPPTRHQYSMWCRELNELVAKSNERKKSTGIPSLARLNSIKSGGNATVPSSSSRNSDIMDNKLPVPLPAIARVQSDSSLPALPTATATAGHRGADAKGEREQQQLLEEQEKEKEQRLVAFRAQNSMLIREKSRRNMLGTLDYTPHETPSSSSSPVATRNKTLSSSSSSSSSSSISSAKPFVPRPLVHAPSLNDMTDTAIFGGVSSMDTLLRPDENGDMIARPTTAIAKEKIRFRRESKFVKNEVFRILNV